MVLVVRSIDFEDMLLDTCNEDCAAHSVSWSDENCELSNAYTTFVRTSEAQSVMLEEK